MGGPGALETGNPIQVTGTGAAQQVLARDCQILGFLYNSGGATPTLSINDSASVAGVAAGNAKLTAMPLSSATLGVPPFTPFPADMLAGLNITLTTGAIVTFFLQ
jgi:hypothetical protein